VDNPPDYVVFDMSAGFSARYYEVAEQIVGGVTNEIYKTSKLVMRKIPAACETFCMGTPQGAVGHQSNENETHVTLTNDYYLGIYELTDGQNSRFTGGTSVSRVPCRTSFSALRGYLDCAQWPADGHAVDAENSIILNVRTASGGLPFDLPTRAQWEFACRAGTTASLYTGEELTVAKNAADPALDDIAWYGFNSGETTATVARHEVGLKAPNAWGLYDMLGNLWEWVLDREHKLPGGSVTEPAGHATNTNRHRCGGGYDSQPQRCRCSSASDNFPNYSNDFQAGVNGSCNANQGVRLWLPAVAER